MAIPPDREDHFFFQSAIADDWDALISDERRKASSIPRETLRQIALEVAELIGPALAERAAEKAVQRLTEQGLQMVGRTVLDKLAWLVGACALGLFMLAVKRGWVTF